MIKGCSECSDMVGPFNFFYKGKGWLCMSCAARLKKVDNIDKVRFSIDVDNIVCVYCSGVGIAIYLKWWACVELTTIVGSEWLRIISEKRFELLIKELEDKGLL